MLELAPARWLTRLARRTGCSSGDRGRIGEELAARHLRALGYVLLGRRVATTPAEVDLVARAPDGALVACEVKAAAPREGVHLRFRPGLHLGPSQRARLIRAARELARRRGLRSWRVELVEVVLGSSGIEVTRRRVGPDSDGAVTQREWTDS